VNVIMKTRSGKQRIVFELRPRSLSPTCFWH
jgi:hypothetical protein